MIDSSRALAAGVQLLRQSKPKEALHHLLAAVELSPQEPGVWFAAGIALRSCGDLAAAESSLRQVLALDPRSADAWTELGSVLASRGVRDEPVRCWERAIAVAPAHVEARVRLASALLARGALEQAGTALAVALKREPEHPGARAAAIALLERRGLHEDAWALAVSSRGHDPRVAIAAASVGRRTGNADVALSRVERSLSRADAADKARLLHARADLLDALDRTCEAFAAYTEANAARGLSFDPARHALAVDRLVEQTTDRPWPVIAAPGSARPVLIVSVPRTGSTVLEQALSRHPDIIAGGELEALRDVVLSVPVAGEVDWIDSLTRLLADDAVCAPARARYLEALPSGPSLRATDKMPNNLLHLGLLAAILPGTRVIRCARDPVDTAWSCFRQAFGAGLPWATSWAGIVTWITQAERLLDHWEKTLPLRFHTVRYEALTESPEGVLRGVSAHLDLPFHEALLAPERAVRQVATASALEVREPVHSRSVGRAERYWDLLPAEVRALGR